MKKAVSILAIAIMTLGMVSCTAESTAEDQALFEIGTDGDDTPTDGRDSTDGDDTPTDGRN